MIVLMSYCIKVTLDMNIDLPAQVPRFLKEIEMYRGVFIIR
jgi:hypothetical protein